MNFRKSDIFLTFLFFIIFFNKNNSLNFKLERKHAGNFPISNLTDIVGSEIHNNLFLGLDGTTVYLFEINNSTGDIAIVDSVA
jgi:hypothetical protein